MNLQYECPNCGNDINGSFGDDVKCQSCKKHFSTDYEYIEDGIACWIVSEIKKDDFL